jgi:hypothetical protein
VIELLCNFWAIGHALLCIFSFNCVVNSMTGYKFDLSGRTFYFHDMAPATKINVSTQLNSNLEDRLKMTSSNRKHFFSLIA